jgi:DNA-binding NarL/FixJ family response regulator
VEHIRVLMSGMPRILRDIVAQLITEQPDMHVVGTFADDVGLDTLTDLQPDVIVIGSDGVGVPALCRGLVQQRPALKVLAVQMDGRRTWLYEMRPHQTLIGEISPATLLDTIRAVSRPAEVSP